MKENYFYSPIIKLPKELIRNEKDFKDKRILTLCYLFFKTDCRKEISLTINDMCKDYNLTLTSHAEKNNQYFIKEELQSLIENNIIECLNYENITKVQNDRLIKLKFKKYEDYINIPSQYVILSLEEFDKILSCKKDISKLVNLYCKIKSHICMDENCLKICYPSIGEMCNRFHCSRNTLKPILNILKENNLIYIYHFDNKELSSNLYNTEYIFSLEKYTTKQIKQSFRLEKVSQ